MKAILLIRTKYKKNSISISVRLLWCHFSGYPVLEKDKSIYLGITPGIFIRTLYMFEADTI